jgi:hypothetical protein
MPSVARTWGTTAAERARPFPCDEHMPDPDDVLWRGIGVAAPEPVVFRWLCQLKVAPYSYDLLDNLGRRSPRELTPGADELAVGDRWMTIFRLVGFTPGEDLTLRTNGWAFGEVVVSYRVTPGRLLAKLLVRHPPPRLLAPVRAEVLAWGDLVMMRKQLRTLKALAERPA